MTDAETTWDGDLVGSEPPYGACVVIFRFGDDGVEFLILHRGHSDHVDGDWAWTPPSGVRLKSEAIDDCAARELLEETGLRLELSTIAYDGEGWPLYFAEAPTDAVVTLSAEHDKFLWVSAVEAQARCLPDVVARQIGRVADALAV